jgi:glucose/arabinose dehydrogenase
MSSSSAQRLALRAASLCLLACSPTDDVANTNCDRGNGDITLPDGFCATIFADEVGVARHLVILADGRVYIALEDAAESSAGTTKMRGDNGRGGIAVLRDTTGDGRADVVQRFGDAGGSGIAVRGEHLYFSTPTTVVRYRLTSDLVPPEPPDTIVRDLAPGGHSSRSLTLDSAGGLFVNIGSDGNVCRRADPCSELERRAGVWRFDANQTNQNYASGERYATGIRNAVGLAWNEPLGGLYATQHGRDGLHQGWPRLFSAQKSAETPSEEFLRVERGDDFGWPYCYHDPELNRKVLAPEYGGDGQTVGRCATIKLPLIGFPGHWGPDGLLFYTGELFPERFRGGAFIAFHGSWNRGPEPEAGYRVVFVPFADGQATGSYETFADGFAGKRMSPSGARHRPVGLAQDSAGALYITDDQRGRVWRVVYVGPTVAS